MAVEGGRKLDISERKPRWGILELVLVYVGIMLAGLLYALLESRWGSFPALLGMADNDFNTFVTAFVIQFLVTILLVWFFSVFAHNARWRDLGIRPASGRDFILYGVIGGWVLLGLVIIMSYPLTKLQPDLPPQVFEQVLRTTKHTSGLIVMLVMGSVLAPLAEELFYRGMIYPVLRRYLGIGWGALASGAIFGLVHWDLWRALPLAVGGFLLCLIYEKTGSILVTALAHGVWNGTLAVIIYFSMMPMV